MLVDAIVSQFNKIEFPRRRLGNSYAGIPKKIVVSMLRMSTVSNGVHTIPNMMNIEGHQAVIAFDAEIEMCRGEFVGLNGGADFYAADVAGLQKEGAISLALFLKKCAEKGIEPFIG